MGTPGMAFIRIDGDFKRIRSRYDGHVDFFGYMCAKTIQAMPAPELSAAARAYQCINSDDDSKNSPKLAPRQAISLFAEMCGDKLGERLRSTYMGVGGEATFGIPYVGLGPGDLDILAHCAAKGLIEREIARAPEAGADLASFACVGARLTASIDPRQGLAFAESLAAQGLSCILEKASILDKAWLLEPELFIMPAAQRMLDEIARDHEFRKSIAKM